MSDFHAELEERLVRYCAVDTQSDETSPTAPSTDIQWDLLRILESELQDIGATEVTLTDYGVVLASIPANVDGAPTIGFCAHVDTAPGYNATGVKPRVIRDYDGGDIVYPDNADLVLSPDHSPYLTERSGDDLITASGTTLLGADDKSGIAIIMTMARHLIENPEIPHGEIRIAFTSDEEIGRGVPAQLPADFACDFAYTLDGGERGELEFESFSADQGVVTITGVSIHPGTAKDRLVNALHLGAKIVGTLPQATMTPETTDGRDGFIMVYEMNGRADECELKFILRDFELDGLAAKGALLRQVCEAVQATEPRARITCEMRPQYRNMRYWLEKDMAPVELARAAFQAEGIEPKSIPIRGGTDGSRFTELGIPCPNIFTGQQDLHGPLEWISTDDMACSTRILLQLVQIASKPQG